jgi:hypothetical protein
MKIVLLFLTTLFSLSFTLAQNTPVQEPTPKYTEDIEKEEAKLSKKEKLKRKKHKAPRKVFPVSKKSQENPEKEMSMDEQIKAADQSDLE